MSGLTYAILGCGALGGLYGARLQRAGFEVHFLARSDYDHLRRHGWRIDSKDGDFVLPTVHVYDRAGRMPRCDVVLVCMKTTANGLLPSLLPPVTGPETLVVTLQNGLGVEEDCAAVVGAEHVAGGLCFLCSNKRGPGWVHHLDYGKVVFGQFQDGKDAPLAPSPRLRQVAADFAAAGTPSELMDDLRAARWRKLCWNIPYNALCAILGADTKVVMEKEASRQLVAAVMREVEAGAAACGKPLPPGFVGQMLADTDAMAPYQPSMQLDLAAGRPLELEAILARPLRAAQAAGCPMPRVETLWRELAFLTST
jgi:2-dehydropantoate 2-reductase